MKRMLLILFGVLPVLFCGCQVQEPPPVDVSHLVTEITITRLTDQQTHHYTGQKSMSRVLNYLRQLDPFGKAAEPAATSGQDYRITLLFSDGRQRTYLQKNGEFFLDGDNHWKQIHPEDARHLSLLFTALPSDEKSAIPENRNGRF